MDTNEVGTWFRVVADPYTAGAKHRNPIFAFRCYMHRKTPACRGACGYNALSKGPRNHRCV